MIWIWVCDYLRIIHPVDDMLAKCHNFIIEFDSVAASHDYSS